MFHCYAGPPSLGKMTLGLIAFLATIVLIINHRPFPDCVSWPCYLLCYLYIVIVDCQAPIYHRAVTLESERP